MPGASALQSYQCTLFLSPSRFATPPRGKSLDHLLRGNHSLDNRPFLKRPRFLRRLPLAPALVWLNERNCSRKRLQSSHYFLYCPVSPRWCTVPRVLYPTKYVRNLLYRNARSIFDSRASYCNTLLAALAREGDVHSVHRCALLNLLRNTKICAILGSPKQSFSLSSERRKSLAMVGWPYCATFGRATDGRGNQLMKGLNFLPNGASLFKR